MSEILALDGDTNTLLFVQDALKGAGHRVAVVKDPKEALDALTHVRFDLVICPSDASIFDESPRWQLPAAVGYQPPLLLISVEAERESSFPVACVQRPFDASRLTAAVCHALRGQENA